VVVERLCEGSLNVDDKLGEHDQIIPAICKVEEPGIRSFVLLYRRWGCRPRGRRADLPK
jgi:hypothetical protein